MQARVLILFFCLFFYLASAQYQQRIRYFEQKIEDSKNESEKIESMGALASYYSVFKLDSKADSILQKVFLIAEESSDKALFLKVLFNNDLTGLNIWDDKATYERNSNFIKKGLQYAQELKRMDYVSLAYIRLAGLSRKRGLFNEAILQVTQAFTALAETGDDSLKCVLYIELGDIYIANNDAIPAYKNYNNAFDLAYKRKNVSLQAKIYHRFAELYSSFGDGETDKKYLVQSLELNKKNNHGEGLFLDYVEMAKLTEDRGYIDSAVKLAEALKSDRAKLTARRLMLYWHMVIGKNIAKTFNYLAENPDVGQFYINQGMAYYYWQKGNIYRYAEERDSALNYYRMAEMELSPKYGISVYAAIYTALADTYVQDIDSTKAKNYYTKAFVLTKQLNQASSLASLSGKLGLLHAKFADFKQAYYYACQADSINKLLQSKSAKDKVVLLQIDRENKNRESDLKEAEQKKRRKDNIQIMAITLIIMGVFAFMLFLGMFAVSKTTIRLLGYFAFISLFEFIIVLLDHPILVVTDGEPIKMWAIKICMIALLVPLQHFLEHRLIHFLQSRKLLEARQRFSLIKWWQRLKKPVTLSDNGIEKEEEDTATL
jgi:hypothetical protein